MTLTKYHLTKLMARATRARRAYETANARENVVRERLWNARQRANAAFRRWQDLEGELAKAKREGATNGAR